MALSHPFIIRILKSKENQFIEVNGIDIGYTHLLLSMHNTELVPAIETKIGTI